MRQRHPPESLHRPGPVDLGRLHRLAREREQRRVEDQEGERQVVPDRDGGGDEQRLHRIGRPIERTEAETGQHLRQQPTSGSIM